MPSVYTAEGLTMAQLKVQKPTEYITNAVTKMKCATVSGSHFAIVKKVEVMHQKSRKGIKSDSYTQGVGKKGNVTLMT